MEVRVFTLLIILSAANLSASGKAKAASSGKWWGVANSQQTSNLVAESQDMPVDDSSLMPLNKKQRKMVKRNHGSLDSVITAVVMAIGECKRQFKNRRWNCPTNENDRGGRNLFGKLPETGCRETAYIYSVTSAAVTHSIARACSEGSITTCDCDTADRGPGGPDWKWGGCSDNVDFGYSFSKKFVDAGEKGRDLKYLMNLHNNEAGRKTVKEETRKECKCHGMSGSCTLETCWKRLPTFKDVGSLLKEKFDGASRVTMGNGRKKKLSPYNPTHKSPANRDLVYFDRSPDFCTPNKKYGSRGTKGRECNSTSIGLDGCDLMCCGRGSLTKEEKIRERCSCTFQWCCEVKCEVCTTEKSVNTCL